MEGEGGSLVGSLAGDKPRPYRIPLPTSLVPASAGTCVVRAGHAVGLVVYDVGDLHRLDGLAKYAADQ